MKKLIDTRKLLFCLVRLLFRGELLWNYGTQIEPIITIFAIENFTRILVYFVIAKFIRGKMEAVYRYSSRLNLTEFNKKVQVDVRFFARLFSLA